MNNRNLSRWILSAVIGGLSCTSVAQAADPYVNTDPKFRAELQARLDLFAHWLGSGRPPKEWMDEALTEDFMSFGAFPNQPAFDRAGWLKIIPPYQKDISSCYIKIVGPIISSGNLAVTVIREQCTMKATGQADLYRSLFVLEKIGGKWKISRQAESEGPMPDVDESLSP